ncbi:hypothetical protein LCGC14_2883140 [marine sediment metagenome]|uniref:Uncharacterized protein n=1 Tax=marine sediment metagenome TaxID=412755 RepID=A0A0F8XZS1_9ZZZZ
MADKETYFKRFIRKFKSSMDFMNLRSTPTSAMGHMFRSVNKDEDEDKPFKLINFRGEAFRAFATRQEAENWIQYHRGMCYRPDNIQIEENSDLPLIVPENSDLSLINSEFSTLSFYPGLDR